MQTSKQFSHELIKGKIAELIFEMMFREAGRFTSSFGYEYTLPEIAQYQHLLLRSKKFWIISEILRFYYNFEREKC